MYKGIRLALAGLGAGFMLVPLSCALAAGSASVQGLSPGNTVAVGTAASFTVVPSGFTNPAFSISDSFNGTSVRSSNINSDGAFTWTPQSGDVGEHDLTITITDSTGDYASVAQTIYVNPVVSTALSLSAVSPGTSVSPGSQVLFIVTPTGFNAGITYSISDSFSGSSVSASNISNSGSFAWMPTAKDGGMHTITISATDPAGHSASVSVTITVALTPAVSVSNLSSTTTTVGTPVTFTALASEFSTTSPAFYAVTDYTSGTSLVSSDMNASSGAFSWTPIAGDIGMHSLVVRAYDASGDTATTNVTLTVTSTTIPSTTTPVIVTTATPSSGLSATQVSAILSLLQSFGVDQSVITTVSAILHGQPVATTVTSNIGTTGDGYIFSNFLHLASSGTDVRELQTRLKLLGFFTGDVTGYFGPVTKAAVEAFQGAHGLNQFGYVGPGTRAALNGQ